MKVLALTRYGSLGASSRLRTFQYLPYMASVGIEVQVQALLCDKALMEKYDRGSYDIRELIRSYISRIVTLCKRNDFSLLWIEKEAMPWTPLWFELGLLRGMPYVLDYDDALFHNYDMHRNVIVRLTMGNRLDLLMARSKLVIGGNSYLSARAVEAGAKWVEVVPTVIDLMRYPFPRQLTAKLTDAVPIADGMPRIVWIGSPSTVQYLQLLREPLRQLAMSQSFVLRVIGGGAVDFPGVQVEVLPWTEATEVENISACQVGVMPLLDSLWERGKCGYKLIQYMACGLPVVASSVGVNPEIVRNGENGYLASTPEDWVSALAQLLQSPSLRAQMGAAGRRRVEDEYCIQKTGPLMAQLLRTAAGKV